MNRSSSTLATITAWRNWLWAGLFLFVLAARLCDLHIVWAEEGYGSAAAVQILHGKMLYRDFWFDKPPLAALLYVFWQGRPGLGLRLAGAAYAFACSVAAYRFAKHLWSEREGVWAACLMAFFLVFDIPASVTTLAPDLLLVLPAILAVDSAARKRGFAAGLWCAAGLAVNAKAVLLIPVCIAWCWPPAGPVVLGLVAGTLPWMLWLIAWHGFCDYWQQVWWFGSQYSRHTFVVHPWREGLLRTANWAGFHAAIVLSAVFYFIRKTLWKNAGWVCWLIAGVLGVVAGERFFTRYYFLLLPPVVLLAAKGGAFMNRKLQVAVFALLIVPFVRFGPRYAMLAGDVLSGRATNWSDVQLNEDSVQAARIINARKKTADTLLVWGYRPDVFAYTRLPLAGKFLDSQLLTGVIADRHLTSTEATFPALARANREDLIRLRPTWIVDGLGVMNPRLAMTAYPELKAWLSRYYEECGRTRGSIVYRLRL